MYAEDEQAQDAKQRRRCSLNDGGCKKRTTKIYQPSTTWMNFIAHIDELCNTQCVCIANTVVQRDDFNIYESDKQMIKHNHFLFSRPHFKVVVVVTKMDIEYLYF